MKALYPVCACVHGGASAAAGVRTWVGGSMYHWSECRCASECKGFVPAAEGGLWPQGLICPGASNWEDSDPGAANGQAECLSPVAGGIHVMHAHVHARVCVHVSFPLLDLPHNQPLRGIGCGHWCPLS